MLLIDANLKTFRVERRASLFQEVFNPSLVNVHDLHIFQIGGFNSDHVPLANVTRYDINKDAWEEMPGLNLARAIAGACFLGGNIYIFCGYNGQYLNSIEKLNVNTIASGGAAW